jgi:hypothetical protein
MPWEERYIDKYLSSAVDKVSDPAVPCLRLNVADLPKHCGHVLFSVTDKAAASELATTRFFRNTPTRMAGTSRIAYKRIHT